MRLAAFTAIYKEQYIIIIIIIIIINFQFY